jgi:hypothetical protein
MSLVLSARLRDRPQTVTDPHRRWGSGGEHEFDHTWSLEEFDESFESGTIAPSLYEPWPR